ncbi:hypothetical protein HK096_010312, partial [Nowakowskiella sp. JEL0078]
MISDFRATFVDTVALIVKFSITMAGLPSSQTKLIFHAMDFAKAAGTHWFVMEISAGMKPKESTIDVDLQTKKNNKKNLPLILLKKIQNFRNFSSNGSHNSHSDNPSRSESHPSKNI